MPVTLRLYTDFVCPFCFIAEASTVPRLLREYELVLDWRGFDAPYSRELAEDMIASPGEFFGHVLWAIQQVSRTDAEFIEDAGKNSRPSSGGSSKAAAAPPTGSPT